MLKRAYLAVAAVFWGVVSFIVAASFGAARAFVWAIVTGVVMVVFARLIDELEPSTGSLGLEPAVMAAAAATIAAALTLFGEPGALPWAPWVAVPIGALSALGVAALAGRRTRHVCFICKTVRDPREMFWCPRCHQAICTQPTCWAARHFRCRYCDEREVVLFPIAEPWWAARIGRRVAKGECASCYKEAHEADLRECGQCHWPMCKRCWDFHNGQCTHCDWMIPDLPPALVAFRPPAPDSRRAHQRQAGR